MPHVSILISLEYFKAHFSYSLCFGHLSRFDTVEFDFAGRLITYLNPKELNHLPSFLEEVELFGTTMIPKAQLRHQGAPSLGWSAFLSY